MGDPRYKSKSLKKLITNVSDTTINDVSLINDEERLNSIASSLSPFPSDPDVEMESETEFASNVVASNLLSSPSVLKASPTLAAKESLDNSRLDVIKTRNSKRKIVEKDSSSVSAVVGGELSEGDHSKPGKTSSRPLDGRDIFDFSLSSEINRYDRSSRGSST